jgi:acyl-coenzyme A thioesterase PaaI-like protein
MATVVFTVATQKQTFPAGTVDTPFVFVVSDSTGAQVATATSDAPTASVVLDVPGNYTVAVTKNAVSVSTAFTIAPTEVTLEVPVSITATPA